MKRSVLITVGIVVIVIIAGVAFMTGGRTNNKSAASTPNPSPSASVASASPSTGSPSASPAANAAMVITYNGSFSPAQTTVKSGGMVTFENKSSEDIQVDSDPHPIHTDDTDLNVGTIAPGQSKTVTLTKKGSFGFHNHLNPSDTGKLVID